MPGVRPKPDHSGVAPSFQVSAALMAPANKLPAVALFTMAAVMPSMPGALRPLGRSRLHVPQAGVDALDGLIGLVRLDGDGQFEFFIGGPGNSMLTRG